MNDEELDHGTVAVDALGRAWTLSDEFGGKKVWRGIEDGLITCRITDRLLADGPLTVVFTPGRMHTQWGVQTKSRIDGPFDRTTQMPSEEEAFADVADWTSERSPHTDETMRVASRSVPAWLGQVAS